MTTFNLPRDFYDRWIDAQSAEIEAGMRDCGRKGLIGNDWAVYVTPSAGAIAGKLTLATELPDGATDVVRLPAQGSRIMAVPYPHLRSLLWDACRSSPILPTEAP